MSLTIVKDSAFFLAASLVTAGSAFAILPYLSRTLDIHAFGEFALALSILQIGITISEFAFGLTSAHRMSACTLEEGIDLFKVITLSRAITTAAATALAAAAAMIIMDSPGITLTCSIALAVVASALLPNWYLISTGEAKLYVLLTLTAKAPAVIAIFVFVDSTSSLSLALGCLYGPSAILGIVAHWRLWNRVGSNTSPNRMLAAIGEIKDNAVVFASVFAVSVYSNMSLPLLAVFADLKSVALYSFADKIVAATRMLLGPIFQASLPAVGCAREAGSRSAIWRAFTIMSGVALICSGILLANAEPLLVWIYGEAARKAKLVLLIMVPIPIFLAISHAFVSLGLLGEGKKRQWSTLIAMGTVVHLLVFFLLVRTPLLPEAAMAIALVSCEALLAIAGIWIFMKPKPTTRH